MSVGSDPATSGSVIAKHERARFADGADEIHQMRIAQIAIKSYTDNGTTHSATGGLPI